MLQVYPTTSCHASHATAQYVTLPWPLSWQPLRGKNTVDLVVVGSILELRDSRDPSLFWPVRVVQNVGGRLRLRVAGLTQDHQNRDSWLFYLDVRLRPLGWALENKLALEPPSGDPACVHVPVHQGFKELVIQVHSCILWHKIDFNFICNIFYWLITHFKIKLE